MKRSTAQAHTHCQSQKLTTSENGNFKFNKLKFKALTLLERSLTSYTLDGGDHIKSSVELDSQSLSHASQRRPLLHIKHIIFATLLDH